MPKNDFTRNLKTPLQILPKDLKNCPKSNKSPNLVTLAVSERESDDYERQKISYGLFAGQQPQKHLSIRLTLTFAAQLS